MIPAADSFEAEWARCAPWIEAALARGPGTHTLADVEAAVRAGAATFWPGRGCALVTEIDTYPQTKVLNFWLAGGDLAELKGVMKPMIERWAKEHQGCTRATFSGRDAGGRVLRDYKPVARLFVKEL